MRLILLMLLALLTVSDISGIDVHLGPGLSAKNALLNLGAFVLIFRIILRGEFKLEVPTIVMAFGILFLYALISSVVAAWVIQFPHYDLKGGIIGLKGTIVDQALLFLTFFYGTRTRADVKTVLGTLLMCMAVANLLTITNVYGFTDVGNMLYGNDDAVEGGRVYGFFGHANETGVLIAVLIPAYAAAALCSKGLWRLALGAGMLMSFIVLMMTASRSAVVALVAGCVWGSILCRRYVSPAKIFRGIAIVVALALPAVALVGAKYGALLIQRIVSQGSSADIGDISSGRTMLWADAIARMMETPLSLITGFGWNVYDSMGFRLIPHNYYIALWFELGLVGVFCFLAIIWTVVRNVLRAMKVADDEVRFQAIACVIGVLTLLVAVFLDQLFKPWLYIWPYIAISLRSAVLARTEVQLSTADTSGADKRRRLRLSVARNSESAAQVQARKADR